MPMRLKSKVYRSMVRPVALYRAECRATTQHLASRFQSMEMNMLRWSLGVTRLDRIPNNVVRMVYGVRPIAEKIAERRLRWCGRVRRSAADSVTALAGSTRAARRRGQGRPSTGWDPAN